MEGDREREGDRGREGEILILCSGLFHCEGCSCALGLCV